MYILNNNVFQIKIEFLKKRSLNFTFKEVEKLLQLFLKGKKKIMNEIASEFNLSAISVPWMPLLCVKIMKIYKRILKKVCSEKTEVGATVVALKLPCYFDCDTHQQCSTFSALFTHEKI